MRYDTDDIRIRDIKQVIAPKDLHLEFPITNRAAETVFHARRDIQRILHGEDDRLLVVVGPCSVHDPVAAMEYANRLVAVRQALRTNSWW